MLSVILTWSDRLIEGVLLVVNQDSARLVLRGVADAVELRRVGDRWRGEDDRPVDFEVLLTDRHGEADLIGAKPLAMAVGCA